MSFTLGLVLIIVGILAFCLLGMLGLTFFEEWEANDRARKLRAERAERNPDGFDDGW